MPTAAAAARRCDGALIPRDVHEAVDTEGDQRQDDEEDNDDDGDDVVLLHGCGLPTMGVCVEKMWVVW
ncbi:hypothetical protein TruAng_000458 [Truncatella angustata]|nr:hypothetical protein TruAng_000458 [Truncatella angustata]